MTFRKLLVSLAVSAAFSPVSWADDCYTSSDAPGTGTCTITGTMNYFGDGANFTDSVSSPYYVNINLVGQDGAQYTFGGSAGATLSGPMMMDMNDASGHQTISMDGDYITNTTNYGNQGWSINAVNSNSGLVTTINMNGHSIENQSTAGDVNAAFEIDSSTSNRWFLSDGTIIQSGENSGAAAFVANGGDFLLENMTMQSVSGVGLFDSGNVVMNGGSIDAATNGIWMNSFTSLVVNGANINVNATSGNLSTSQQAGNDSSYGVNAQSNATTVLNNTTITASKDASLTDMASGGALNLGNMEIHNSQIDVTNGTGVVTGSSDNTGASDSGIHTAISGTTITADDGVQSWEGGTLIRQSTVQGTHSGITMSDGNVVTAGADISATGIDRGVSAALISDNGTATFTDGSLIDGTQGNDGTFAIAQGSGTGTVNLTGAGTSMKGRVVSAGTLNLDISNDAAWNGSVSNLGGYAGTTNLTLNKGLWNINGSSSVSTLNNGGAIVFADTSGGSPVAEYNTTLTVTGDYTGSNGYLVTNVDSGTGAGSADQLVVNGDATGNTNVGIGKVAATQADQAYIPVVTVDGDASGASFTQVGRASVGGYEYLLRSGDNNGHTVWYLSDLTKPSLPPGGGGDTDPPGGGGDTDPPGGGGDTDPPGGGGTITPPPSSGGTRIVAPETAAYESNNLMAYRMMFETYHDRTGSAFAGTGDGTGLFLRTNGGRETFSSAEGQLKTNSNLISVELGARLGKYALGEGSLEWGVTGTYGHGNSTSTSSVTGYQAKGMTDGYTGGLYATWLQTADESRGAYVDTWAKYGNFQNSVKGDDMSEVTYHTNGFAGSVEGGYTFRAYRGQETSFYIQPQAQMAWVGMDMKDHQDGLGNTVSSTDSGNLVSRAGVRLYWEGTSPVNRAQTFRPYMAFNYINNSSNGGVTYKSSMGQTEFSPQGVTNIGQAKLGVEGKLSRNMTIYASVAQEMGGDGYHSTFGNLGVKATF